MGPGGSAVVQGMAVVVVAAPPGVDVVVDGTGTVVVDPDGRVVEVAPGPRVVVVDVESTGVVEVVVDPSGPVDAVGATVVVVTGWVEVVVGAGIRSGIRPPGVVVVTVVVAGPAGGYR
jgi:hypothetical protein